MEDISPEEFRRRYGVDPTPVELPPSGIGRTARNLGAGIIEAIPQAIGFVGTTVPALAQTSYDYFSSQMGHDSFMERLAQRHMRPGGMEAVQSMMNQEVANMRRDVPDATPEELTRAVEDYKKTKEFYDAMTPQFHPTMRFSRNASSWANDLVGINESPEEQSGWDSAERIIGGALVGLPRSIVAGAGKAIGTSALGGALSSGPGMVAGRVLEALTPVTLPLSIPNIALNAGVGIGLDTAIRHVMGEDNIGNTPVSVGGAAISVGILGAAALMLMGGGRGLTGAAVSPNVTPTAVPNASGLTPPPPPTDPASAITASSFPNPPPMATGPASQPGAGTLREQALLPNSIRDNNFVGIMDHVQAYGNEFHQIRALAQVGNRTSAEIYAAEAVFSNNTGMPAISRVNAAINQGEFDGINLHDPRGFQYQYNRLTPDMRETLNAGINSARILEDNVELLAQSKRRIGEIQAELAYHNAAPPGTSRLSAADVTRRNNELANLQAREAEAIAYAPSMRTADVAAGKAELQARIDAMMNNPELAALKAKFQALSRAELDLKLYNGSIDGTAHRTLQARQHYAPRQEQEFPGETGTGRWLNRLADLAKQDLRLNDIGGSQIRIAGQTVDDILDVPTSFRVNYLANPVEGLMNNLRSDIAKGVQMKARNAMIQLLTSDKNINAGHIRPWMDDKSGKSVFTPNDLKNNPALQRVVDQAAELNPNIDSAYLVHQYPGGQFRVMQFANKDVRNIVLGLPNPELGIMGYSAQAWKHGTTGLLNPLFRFTSMAWDNNFAMLFRNNGRDFGLIQAGLRRALGDKIGDSAAVQMLSSIDPTTILQSLAGSARLYVGGNSLKAAHHIADALLEKRSVWSGIADRVGRPQFERMVHKWAQSADNSMTAQFWNSGSGQGVFNGELIDNGRNKFAALMPKVPPILQHSFSQYKLLLDSIDSGTKFAFYAQNTSKMNRQAGGAGKVSDVDRQQLLFETRTISGDMSRRSGSQFIRKMEQVVPYQSAIRNSLTFVYGNFYRGVTDLEYAKVIWPRMVMYGTAQMGMMYGFLSMSQSNRDHFFDGLTDWQRAALRAIPANFETAYAMVTRQERPYNSEDWLWIREAPELNVFTSAIMGGLQAFGLMPTSDREGRQWSAAYQAMMNTITPPPPPLAQAAMAASGYRIDLGRLADGSSMIRPTTPEVLSGSLSDKLYSNNPGGISRTMADMLNAVMGTSGGMLASMLDAAKTTHPDAGPLASLQAFINEGAQQITRTAPDVPFLWNTEDRMFLQTAADKNVKDKLAQMNSISMTWARTMGDAATARRGDPALGPNIPELPQEFQPIAQQVNQFMRSNSSEFKQAQEQRASLVAERRQIQSNYQLEMRERLRLLNDNSVRIRDIRLNQETLINEFEAQLTERNPALAQQLGGAITLSRVVEGMQQSMRPSSNTR